MESEGSLPCSQEPSTGPYPVPDQSSPYDPILPKTATLSKIVIFIKNIFVKKPYSIFIYFSVLSVMIRLWGS
jgi:hypothetical protein